MRTYTHGLIGYLIYLRGTWQQQKLAIIGAMIPDSLLAIGFIFHYLGDSGFVESIHQLFHFSFLHTITELMHSFTFIIPLGVLAYVRYKTALPFLVGMASHAITDFLTHQRGTYNHLFPLPIDAINGPMSYLSTGFTIGEHVVFFGVIGWILYKKRQKKAKKHK